MIPGIGFVFTLHFGPAQAPVKYDDRWLSSDKAKHFFTSMFVESLTYSAIRVTRVSKEGSLISASIVTAGVGIGKEIYDLNFGGDPSFKDLTADAAGIGAGAALMNQTRR
ncbi:MAG TPA: hypothetical protein VGM50_08150 [Gemmatimonadaceae bacterium]|jgi:uncharacterized protein YfiM (DUF2279 family)